MSFDAVGTEHKDCHLRLFSWISQLVLKVATGPSCDDIMGEKVHFSLCWRQGKHLSRRQLALLELGLDCVSLRLCRPLSQRVRYTGSPLSALAYFGAWLSHDNIGQEPDVPGA